ncbi:MAG: hypothetical protein Kow00121_23860 [Elainellaceae cyanobacterium]
MFGSSDFGDSPDDAENVGTLKRSTSYSYSGDVGGRDLDFFKFQNDQKRSAFSLSLSNKSSNEPIAVSVLNRRGRVVKQGSQFLFKNIEAGETGTISVNRLRKSTFFIRIQSAEGNNEDYDLEFSLSSTGSIPIDDAFNIGSLAPGRRYAYNGRVGSSDIDFYRFQVNETSRISGSLFSDRFNDESIAVSVLDSQRRTVQTESGRFLFTNVNPGQIGTVFAPTLAPGEYYLRVQSALGRDEQYRLELARSAVTVIPLAA